jgi:DNA-binding PadR family transcriptional regulator
MNTLSNAEVALLGLLSEQSMYPYQIEQEVKYRDMRFWTSIYKLLRKLEKEGMVMRKNQISPGNRLQKLYSLSDTGKAALLDSLDNILRLPEHARWQIDLGINNCHLLPKKNVREALLAYRKELRNKIECYHKLLKFLIDTKCPQHRHALAKRPVFLFEAEIKWVDSFLAELTKSSTKSTPR